VAFAGVVNGKSMGAEGGEEGLDGGDYGLDEGYVVALVDEVAFG
jgi:hypothetical protein